MSTTGSKKKAIVFQTRFDSSKEDFILNLTATQAGTKIRYTLDGSAPTLESRLYDGPVTVKTTSDFIAQSEMRGRLVGNPIDLAFKMSKALNSTVLLKNSYSPKYPAGGVGSVVDGIRGTMEFHDGLWQGYEGVDIEAVIDFGEEKEISEAGAGFYQEISSWIFMPDSVEFYVSNDGANFTNVGTSRNDVPQKYPDPLKKDFSVSFDKRTARYIKMVAKNIGVCPPWHDGAGGKAWLFVDEIYAN